MRRRRTIPTKPMAVLAAIALPLSSAAAVYAAVPREPRAEALNRLYTPPAGTAPYRQVTRLVRHGDRGAAAGVLAMLRTPHAVWYGDETPEEVEQLVRATTRRAARRGLVPVLALYNAPGRDCGNYSAGGAKGTAEYRAWIDAVARGIGNRRALIVLEPDSLALLPSDCDRAGGAAGGHHEDARDEFPGEREDAAEAGEELDGGVDGDVLDSELFAGGAGVLGGAPARAEAQAQAEARLAAQTAPPVGADLPADLPADVRAGGPEDARADVGTGTGTGNTVTDTPGGRPAGQPADPHPDRPTADGTVKPTQPAGPTQPTQPTQTTQPTQPTHSTVRPAPTPAELRARTAARYAEIHHAVETLEPLPGAKVYLDAGHAGWHSVTGIVGRLLHAGVDHATGFAINVSHYQTDEDNAWYGRLISSCLAYVADGGDIMDCPDQRWTRLRAERWLEIHVLDEPEEMKHFVTDTSRNGRGPWTPRPGSHADPQPWCNPPGRGLGIRPTTRTGDPLHDAALWVKTPGESDGQCLRGTAGPLDPERGTVDPEAGQWFPEQALELVRFARPAL
ncbi:glycoside hydrolase family 6 protein [Streptomyces sparsogenes]|uniref:glycoside hydrolase family 6 protein n=1 Tax=Streptomyces sparsogenes TaxID=67365 RepID=UPI003F4CCC1A